MMQRAEAPCAFGCGRSVDLERDHHRRVHGWERTRSQGGANQIILREVEPGTVACEDCIRRGRYGIAQEQASLL